MHRQFHPIAFAISSHEQEADFTKFFNSINKLCDDLDITIDIAFAMQDAWYASFNAFS